MNYPKMIIFDYGHTLMCEPNWEISRGWIALSKYLTKNPLNLTPEDILAFDDEYIPKVCDGRGEFREVHEHTLLRLLNECLGLEYSISLGEQEKIWWNAVSDVKIMPETDKMLVYLRQNRIRTAVISNIVMSEAALEDRIRRYLPEHEFEFIIASSEYGIRKPNPLIFKLALQKSGLKPNDVWYCGDNPAADVMGSAAVGMFPVWYDSEIECSYRDKSKENVPTVNHLHIKEWHEMIELLEKLKRNKVQES